jgi:hypothetical protein
MALIGGPALARLMYWCSRRARPPRQCGHDCRINCSDGPGGEFVATNLNGQRFDDALDIALTDTHIVAGCTYVVGLASLVLASWARAVLGKDATLLWAQTVDSC